VNPLEADLFCADARVAIELDGAQHLVSSGRCSRWTNIRSAGPFDVVMQRHIEAALRETHGRVEGPYGAARLLRINPHTLRARMRKHTGGHT
jgi:transcriptional regulator with GAF, ATPase, and Fis domain